MLNWEHGGVGGDGVLLSQNSIAIEIAYVKKKLRFVLPPVCYRSMLLSRRALLITVGLTP